jgi:hypothetical protein
LPPEINCLTAQVYVYHKSQRLGWAAVGVVLLLSLGARFMVATLYHDTLRLDVNFATRAFYMRARLARGEPVIKCSSPLH